eukprot:1154719-Pelagomonas_calceolata.AAC.3
MVRYAHVLQSGTLSMRVGLDRHLFMLQLSCPRRQRGAVGTFQIRHIGMNCVESRMVANTAQLPFGFWYVEKEVFPGWGRIVDRCSIGWYVRSSRPYLMTLTARGLKLLK